MIAKPLYAAILLIFINMANSYILLTANLEDVHVIAKQIVASPVAQQINKIIRRASNLFNQQMAQPNGGVQLRADDGDASDGKVSQHEQRAQSMESGEASASDSQQHVERRHGAGEELAALGKNASFYLASINKILQNV